MTKEEIDLLITQTSLRPAPSEAAVIFAMLTVGVIFAILGIVLGLVFGFVLGMRSVK